MVNVTYNIVQHDGGWAYKVADVFSETFPTREAALRAARDAAARQQLAGESEGIVYEDADSHWHEEVASGDDRPQTSVVQ
ncbi:DUF2188 domain-containing protein [Aurantimonas sp. Leaf443]|uniref:DUF2188 domain-containing protein n=1 Tax=Aurantimonas sp. Leaf443 TaxID=1736378 RepID=UPI0006F73624|nr:DUF2188 domain-containing protein [Aurantimonas sp. Leaf443]KQT85354.1 hypothetical protein ASG48_08910 [Aurantimonas sp. Leaf443]